MDDPKQGQPNRLIGETSPYLLQHAYNPVKWYPWGEEALEEAKQADKPILLSIGYSACHWCHVMARESFDNTDIAAIMNEHFINVKVDREERPDLDQIYQSAAQLLSGQGGWPLTVFLTPDQRPFYAGTYFPPEDRHGRPGFPRLLQTLIRLYRTDPGRIEKTAVQVTKALKQLDAPSSDARAVPLPEDGHDLLAKAVEWLETYVDDVNGGFGSQPKFANTPVLDFLLRQSFRSSNQALLDHCVLTLDQMVRGGLYDQLGGGFHRYCVDDRWLIPHFEKMLYDNALLVLTYLHGYQLTKSPNYREVVDETLAYVEREMSHPQGGFYSAQDADSEGQEGKFFVWSRDQIDEVFDPATAQIVADRFGVTETGNFQRGTTVLHRSMDVQTLLQKHGVTASQIETIVDAARAKLLAAREKRVKPGRDEKVITGWNALMISAYARSSLVLDAPDYIKRAEKAVSFVREHLIHGDRLMRSFKGRPSGIGYLKDYAYWVQALIDVYEATFHRDYLHEALMWMDRTIELFWDDHFFGFFITPPNHEQLIHRPKDWRDQSVPSATGVSVANLMRLHRAADDRGYQDKADQTLQGYRRQLDQNPWVTAALLTAYDDLIHGLTEVVIVASEHQLNQAGAFARAYGSAYVPGVLHQISPEEAASKTGPLLWRGKSQVGGAVTAYVCRDFTCTPPMTRPEDLARALQAGAESRNKAFP